VRPNEPSGFFAGISLIFVLILRFVFVWGAFIWAVDFLPWGKGCAFLFALIFRGVILQGNCLAFGEFSSLRTRFRGACCMRLLYGDIEHVKQQICNGIF
jgi:hypothetical protein